MYFKLAAAILALVALWGAARAIQLHERSIGAKACETRVSTQYRADVAAAAASTAQITIEREAARHDADTLRAQALADRASAPAADERVRHAASAVLVRCLPQHPAAPGIGQAAASAPGLPADVQGRLESFQRRLDSMVEFADTTHAAGVECVGAYPVK